jgi:hypothetical protein
MKLDERLALVIGDTPITKVCLDDRLVHMSAQYVINQLVLPWKRLSDAVHASVTCGIGRSANVHCKVVMRTRKMRSTVHDEEHTHILQPDTGGAFLRCAGCRGVA